MQSALQLRLTSTGLTIQTHERAPLTEVQLLFRLVGPPAVVMSEMSDRWCSRAWEVKTGGGICPVTRASSTVMERRTAPVLDG